MAYLKSNIILRPRVTEKAAYKAESKVYTFEIAPKATKGDVTKAIKEIFKVTPVQVNIVRTPVKKVFKKGKLGHTAAVKKAYVYLNKADTIEFI